jgi:hypothetical protein
MDKRQYNCGGYALKSFNWFDFPLAIGSIPFGETKLKACARWICHKTKGKIISKEQAEKAKKEEIVVAFKISKNGDFHFMRKGKNNHWKHKMGNLPAVFNVDKKTVFSKKWDYSHYQIIKGFVFIGNCYDSETVFIKLE